VYLKEDVILNAYEPKDNPNDYLTMLRYDFNGDGNMDLFLGGGMLDAMSGDEMWMTQPFVLLGDGIGHFNQQQYYTKPSRLHNISDFGDYNKDGHVDMLMYYYWGNGFYLYTGNGNGIMSFNPNPKKYSTGTHGGETKFVDYDNDGDLDIFSLSAGSGARSGFHVFENVNNRFAKTSYYTQSNASFMMNRCSFYKDFNNDNLIDALVYDKAGYDGFQGASLFMQGADHRFSEMVLTDNIGALNGLNVGDVNKDGNLDVVIENFIVQGPVRSKMSVYYGSVHNPEFFDFSSADMTVELYLRWPINNSPLSGRQDFGLSDIDGDGSLDIISHHESTKYTDQPDELVVFFNPFDVSPMPEPLRISYRDYYEPALIREQNSFIIEDINRDGKMDIITHTRNDATIRTFMNKSIATSSYNPIKSKDINVFPNPSSEKISIDYSGVGKIKCVSLWNITGEEIFVENGQVSQIDISKWPNGIYFVQIIDSYNVRSICKLIKK